jgi:hypothetical protein
MDSIGENLGCIISSYGGIGGYFAGGYLYRLLAPHLQNPWPLLPDSALPAAVGLLCYGGCIIGGTALVYAVADRAMGLSAIRENRHNRWQAQHDWNERLRNAIPFRRTVEILDWGELGGYAKRNLGDRANGTGAQASPCASLRIRRTGDKIRARPGRGFGIRFRVNGLHFGERLTVRVRVLTPGAGNLTTSEKQIQSEWEMPVDSGVPTVAGSVFEEKDVIPGIWAFQVLQGRKVAAEKEFTVE